jgi:hypothetical protein
MSPRPKRSSGTAHALDGLVSRYRLWVLSPVPDDAVRFAGGLIFDKVASGWDVVVLLPNGDDSMPLRILGATVGDLDDHAFVESLDSATALVAPADGGDERTRSLTGSALTDSRTEVVFWGGTPSALNIHSFNTIDYRMSTAARAYKTHALAAAGFDTEPGVFVETFVSARGRSQTAADLMAVTDPLYQRSATSRPDRVATGGSTRDTIIDLFE